MSNLKTTGFSPPAAQSLAMLPRSIGSRLLGAVAVATAMACLSGCGSDGAQAGTPEPAASSSPGRNKAIEGIWLSYRRALIEQNSRDAGRMVTQGSLLHYARLRDLALTAPRSELLAQTMLDRATILSMRASMPVSTLRSAGDQEVFGLIVSKKLIDADSLKESTVAGIQVSGSVARGFLVLKGQETSIGVSFKHEAGRWTVDLTDLFTEMEATFLETTTSQDITEQEYAEFLATNRLGQDKSKILKAYQPPTE
ncbi:MAG: hypothetical protein QG608_1299 [Actinomycetota bacterium]|nr:hypothetical protein [Actinomycetota bacterium]